MNALPVVYLAQRVAGGPGYLQSRIATETLLRPGYLTHGLLGGSIDQIIGSGPYDFIKSGGLVGKLLGFKTERERRQEAFEEYRQFIARTMAQVRQDVLRGIRSFVASVHPELDQSSLRRALTQLHRLEREINHSLSEIVTEAGRDVVLPRARANILSFGSGSRRRGSIGGDRIAQTLMVRPGRRGAFLTSGLRGNNARVVGLLEFGGTVGGIIVPNDKRALALPNGIVVSRVKTPRHYKGLHFMRRAISDSEGALEHAIEQGVEQAIRRSGAGA